MSLLISVLFAVLILSSSGFICPVRSSTEPSLSIVPQTVFDCVGRDFTVNVSISNVSISDPLYGWEFKLNWTVSLLTNVSVVEGPFLKESGDTFFTYNSNDSEGHLIVDCTLLGEALGASGNGVLAIVTFHVNATGHSPLNLYEATLIDNNEMQIPCQVTSGYAGPLPGDINGDGKVNLEDLVFLANAYGTTPASGGIPGAPHAWNPNADIDGDGVVGLSDLVILALHYGQTVS